MVPNLKSNIGFYNNKISSRSSKETPKTQLPKILTLVIVQGKLM